jgi:CRP/FNR family transcriptional regulator, cyclic AMP receptor protein
MLDGIPEPARTEFLAAARRRRFGAGEVLFHAGDPAGSVHVIRRGHVAVRRSTRLGDVVTLTVLGPGQLLGELGAIVPDGQRSATVVALDPTETLSWDRREMAALRAEHPSVDTALVELLIEQVHSLTAHLTEALFEPADLRVLRRLLNVCRLYGDGEPGTVIPLTQDDVASMAGTTRPTANRALRALEDDGVVTLSRGRITILRPDELARRAR